MKNRILRLIFFQLLLCITIIRITAMEYLGSPFVTEITNSSAIYENILYTGTNWGIMIYDVSEGNEPILMNKIRMNEGRGASLLNIVEGKLIVSGLTTTIFNLSDPINPEEIY